MSTSSAPGKKDTVILESYLVKTGPLNKALPLVSARTPTHDPLVLYCRDLDRALFSCVYQECILVLYYCISVLHLCRVGAKDGSCFPNIPRYVAL
jgi:hypothetical protein